MFPTGSFVSDSKAGPGVLYYPGGSRREGEWLGDTLRGHVTLVRGDQQEQEVHLHLHLYLHLHQVWLEEGIYTGESRGGEPEGKGTIVYFEEVPPHHLTTSPPHHTTTSPPHHLTT